MGHLSSQSETETNPWSPANGLIDDTAALLNCLALRCCHCRRVIAKRHIVMRDRHAFCPDCQQKACVTDGRCQANIGAFLEHNDPRRPTFGYGASGGDGEAD